MADHGNLVLLPKQCPHDSVQEACHAYMTALGALEKAMIPSFGAADNALSDLKGSNEPPGWDPATEPKTSLVYELPPIELSPEDRARFREFGGEFQGPLTRIRDSLDLAAHWARPSFYDGTRSLRDKQKYFMLTETHHTKLLAAFRTKDLLAKWRIAVNNDSEAVAKGARLEAVIECFNNFRDAVGSASDMPPKERDRTAEVFGLNQFDEAVSLEHTKQNETSSDMDTDAMEEDSFVIVGPYSFESPVGYLTASASIARSRSPSDASTIGSLDLDEELAKMRD